MFIVNDKEFFLFIIDEKVVLNKFFFYLSSFYLKIM